MNSNEIPVERHPLKPFLPRGARLLMLGSFPPPRNRWRMDFFYPNPSNQMWNIFGLLFYGDAERFVDKERRGFRQADIQSMLAEHGIAVYDTATAVCRMNGNASDKGLCIVEKTDLSALLSDLPLCGDIVCTGQKSISVIVEDYGASVPPMGMASEFILGNRIMRLWRMPSSSRAYPMRLHEKAGYYRRMMVATGILK